MNTSWPTRVEAFDHVQVRQHGTSFAVGSVNLTVPAAMLVDLLAFLIFRTREPLIPTCRRHRIVRPDRVC